MKKKQETLKRFERKIIRLVYSPVKKVDEWRMRNNQETDELLNHEDIIRFIKFQRILWLGRLERTDDQRMPCLLYTSRCV